jgi:hypothetical protein
MSLSKPFWLAMLLVELLLSFAIPAMALQAPFQYMKVLVFLTL